MRIGKLSIRAVVIDQIISTRKVSIVNWQYYKNKFGDVHAWLRVHKLKIYVGWIK